jgi:hypothetical protein
VNQAAGSAGTRAERRARGEGARAHAETAERRRNVTEKIAAARAAAIVADGIGGISAQPVAAGIALRIDTLHGKAGHVLHRMSSLANVFSRTALTQDRQNSPEWPKPICWGGFCR